METREEAVPAEIKPSFTLARNELRQVWPDVFNGSVCVNVRTMTSDEYEEAIRLAEFPLGKEGREVWLKHVGAFVTSIEGLVVEGVGPITSIEACLQNCPPWVVRVMYGCVILASRLTGVELERSRPRSSGGKSTKPGTAAGVDSED